MALMIFFILLWYSKSLIWTTIFRFIIGNSAAIVLGIIRGHKTICATRHQTSNIVPQIKTNKKSLLRVIANFL
jgi:hypothetical protein